MISFREPYESSEHATNLSSRDEHAIAYMPAFISSQSAKIEISLPRNFQFSWKNPHAKNTLSIDSSNYTN